MVTQCSEVVWGLIVMVWCLAIGDRVCAMRWGACRRDNYSETALHEALLNPRPSRGSSCRMVVVGLDRMVAEILGDLLALQG